MTTVDYDKRWGEDFPELGTGPVPTEPCYSPEYFRLEQEKVFAKVWLHVGRVEEVAEPNDYFMREIAVCRTSVIVWRDADGQLHAFHNVCRHRGNKLIWENERRGNRPRIQCRFHGWTYTPDGRLTTVPDEKMFVDLRKENCGLMPVAVDVWEGFIFVNLDPEPKESLTEYLGEMGEHLGGFPYSDYPTCYTYRAELDANWKVCLDAFSEDLSVESGDG